jgi:hypothetical protein
MTESKRDIQVERVIAIVTLDRAQPFWNAIGIQGPEPARALVAPLRKWLHSSLDPSSAVLSLSAEVHTAIGPAASDRFTRWLDSVARAWSRPVDRAWQLIFTKASRMPSDWASLGLPESLRSEAFSRTTTDGSLFSAYTSLPLSDWDTGIWALLKFDEDENDPINTLNLLASRWSFMQFWRTLEAVVTDRERSAIVAKAQAFVTSLRMPVELHWLAIKDWPA